MTESIFILRLYHIYNYFVIAFSNNRKIRFGFLLKFICVIAVFITIIDACIIAECLYLFFVIIPIISESNGKNSNITNGMNKTASGKFKLERKK